MTKTHRLLANLDQSVAMHIQLTGFDGPSDRATWQKDAEREIAHGVPVLNILERFKEERDQSRAEYKELLNRIKSLTYGEDLKRQVAQLKTDLFGLNLTFFEYAGDRVYEYDSTSAQLHNELIN